MGESKEKNQPTHPHPQPLDTTPLTFIDTPSALASAASRLSTARAIALDLEAHSYRSFAGFTCLIQLSTRDEDVIVDALALRQCIGPILGPLFADPSIAKVAHGARGDIEWLQRDFGVCVVNLFDTGLACRALGRLAGLAPLLADISGVTADKRWQLADWRTRPLPRAALDYARADTHYLLHVADELRRALLTAGDDIAPSWSAPPLRPGAEEAGALGAVLEASRRLCLTLYTPPAWSPASALETACRAGLKRDSVAASVFVALSDWRDAAARAADESVGFIAPKALLVKLARAAPTTPAALAAVAGGSASLVMARSGDVVAAVAAAVAAAAEADREREAAAAAAAPAAPAAPACAAPPARRAAVVAAAAAPTGSAFAAALAPPPPRPAPPPPPPLQLPFVYAPKEEVAAPVEEEEEEAQDDAAPAPPAATTAADDASFLPLPLADTRPGALRARGATGDVDAAMADVVAEGGDGSGGGGASSSSGSDTDASGDAAIEAAVAAARAGGLGPSSSSSSSSGSEDDGSSSDGPPVAVPSTRRAAAPAATTTRPTKRTKTAAAPGFDYDAAVAAAPGMTAGPPGAGRGGGRGGRGRGRGGPAADLPPPPPGVFDPYTLPRLDTIKPGRRTATAPRSGNKSKSFK